MNNENIKLAIEHGKKCRETTYSPESIKHDSEFERYMKKARIDGVSEKELLQAAHEVWPGTYSKDFIATQEKYLTAKELLKLEKDILWIVN